MAVENMVRSPMNAYSRCRNASRKWPKQTRKHVLNPIALPVQRKRKGYISGCLWEQGDNLLGIISHICVTVAEDENSGLRCLPKGRFALVALGWPSLNMNRKHQSALWSAVLFSFVPCSAESIFRSIGVFATTGTGKLREALTPSKLQLIYPWWCLLSHAGEEEELQEEWADPAGQCLVLQQVLWAEIWLLQSQNPLWGSRSAWLYKYRPRAGKQMASKISATKASQRRFPVEFRCFQSKLSAAHFGWELTVSKDDPELRCHAPEH